MHWLAERMTHFFIKKNIFSKEEFDIYVYCFEIMFSTIFNCIILFFGAIISGKYYETALFAFTFMLLRRYSGGYHAKTHYGCLILLIITYIGFILALTYIKLNILNLIAKYMSIFVVLIILFFAPLDHSNNPISEHKKKRMRVISIIIISLIMIISVILFNHYSENFIAFSMIYAASCVAISVLFMKIVSCINNKRTT